MVGIQTANSYDVTIDTSALNDAFLETNVTMNLVHAIQSRRCRLVVPTTCIKELLGGGKNQHRTQRATALRGLIRTLGGRLSFAKDPKTIIRLELKRRMHITPTASKKQRDLVIYMLKNSNSDEVGAIGRDFSESKSTQLHTDRLAGEQIGSQLNPATIVSIIRNYTGISADATKSPNSKWMLELALRHCFSSRFSPEKILENIDRYPFLRTMIMIDELNILGAMLPTNEGSQEAQIFRTQLGNWADVTIAATAAYSRFFISNDKNQVNKCFFLRQKSLIPFDSISLAAFLDASNSV